MQLGRIEALRDRRLRRLVAHAYRAVPFYRRIFDELDLKPTDFQTSADLSKLPVVTGRDLADNPHEFLSGKFSEEDSLELSTTGTTGQFKRIFFDPAALFQARAAGLRKRHVLFRLLGHSGSYRELAVAR